MSDIDTGTDLHRLVERASQLVPFGGVRSIEVLDAVDGFARIEYVGEFVAGAGREPSVSVDGHKVPGNGVIEFARAYGLATQARAERRAAT